MPIRQVPLPLLFTLTIVVASQPVWADKRHSDMENVKATVTRFWSVAGTRDIASTKSTYAFPVSLVEVTPTGAGTNFIFTQRDFDNEAKRHPVRVALNAHLSRFRIQMIAPNLASVTYKMSIPRRTASSRVFDAQTLRMQTLLKMDTRWKIVYSTIPYNM